MVDFPTAVYYGEVNPSTSASTYSETELSQASLVQGDADVTVFATHTITEEEIQERLGCNDDDDDEDDDEEEDGSGEGGSKKELTAHFVQCVTDGFLKQGYVKEKGNDKQISLSRRMALCRLNKTSPTASLAVNFDANTTFSLVVNSPDSLGRTPNVSLIGSLEERGCDHDDDDDEEEEDEEEEEESQEASSVVGDSLKRLQNKKRAASNEDATGASNHDDDDDDDDEDEDEDKADGNDDEEKNKKNKKKELDSSGGSPMKKAKSTGQEGRRQGGDATSASESGAGAEKPAKNNNSQEKQKQGKGGEENKGKSSVTGVKLQAGSGVTYEILTVGQPSSGVARVGKKVKVRYAGRLAANGKQFDKGVLSFVIGAKQMIEGFDKGARGMLVNESRRIFIPAAQGYGNKPSGPIPRNSDLIFDVTLLSVN